MLKQSNRRSSRQSQVTVFIILAILVFVLLVIYVVQFNRISSGKISTSQSLIAASGKSGAQVSSYLGTCLQSALDDFLLLVGRQGGFVFNYQEGSAILFPIDAAPYESTVGGVRKSFNVTFLNQQSYPRYILSDDRYPCVQDNYASFPDRSLKGRECEENFTHRLALRREASKLAVLFAAISNYQQANSTYGNVDLNLDLCSTPQSINITGKSGEYLVTVCSPSASEQKRRISLQNQAEYYLKYKMDQCLDEAGTFLSERLNSKMLERGNVSVKVYLGDKATSASAAVLLRLSFNKVDAGLRNYEVHADSRVRLKLIYALLYGNNVLIENQYTHENGTLSKITEGIIDRDFTDILFDIDSDSRKLMSDYNIYNVSVRHVYDNLGSIIKVTDTESVLKGEPYEYYLRLRNRRPILDSFPKIPGKQYNLAAFSGQRLVIAPEAFDLDDEYFPDDSTGAAKSLRYTYEVMGIGTNDSFAKRGSEFYDNMLYRTGYDGRTACINEKYGITENRCTSLLLNDSDIGMHRLKITAIDSYGSSDSQIIDLFVDRRQSLAYSISSIYSDILQTYALAGRDTYVVSPEDPFILNTSGSAFSAGAGENSLTWQDDRYTKDYISNTGSKDPKRKYRILYPIRYSASENVIVHPGYLNYSAYSFLREYLDLASSLKAGMTDDIDVKSRLLSLKAYSSVFDINMKYGYPIDMPVPEKISSLSVSYLKSGVVQNTATRQVYIAECFPHRNNETPIYPFNLIRTLGDKRELNPYLGNHTCCLGDPANPLTWRLSPQGTQCYNLTRLGTYNELVASPDSAVSYTLFSEMNPTFASIRDYPMLKPSIAPVLDFAMDRYVMTVAGRCTGTRGNYCDPYEFTIQKLPYCGRESRGNSYRYNVPIKQTSVTSRDASQYYSGGLCTCGQYVMSMSNSSYDTRYSGLHNELYCCYNANNVPYKLSNTTCIVPDCIKYDTHAKKPVERKIGSTVFNPTKPGPFCRCGSTVVDTTDAIVRESYCCNPLATSYEVKDTPDECS